MKVVKKKCKGIGKAKGYGCGVETFNRVYGLGKMCCYAYWLLTSENGKIKLEKSRIKSGNIVLRDRAKKRREDKKIFIENNKTITQLINEAKVPFQKWVRLRDENLRCISCGSDSDLVDGGHFYKAEIYRGLIFNEDNCHKQCRKCNRYLGGNENNYRLGLIDRYGEDFVKELDKISDENRTYDYTREQLKEIKYKYLDKIKNI